MHQMDTAHGFKNHHSPQALKKKKKPDWDLSPLASQMRPIFHFEVTNIRDLAFKVNHAKRRGNLRENAQVALTWRTLEMAP
ncbi:MAG: hypothetical protein C4519_08850 [Desulfobacteraceae bacterium]|nr:MAG: hypothetical protein C4519_08850 [Desulfobacteraceae bacterium]